MLLIPKVSRVQVAAHRKFASRNKKEFFSFINQCAPEIINALQSFGVLPPYFCID